MVRVFIISCAQQANALQATFSTKITLKVNNEYRNGWTGRMKWSRIASESESSVSATRLQRRMVIENLNSWSQRFDPIESVNEITNDPQQLDKEIQSGNGMFRCMFGFRFPLGAFENLNFWKLNSSHWRYVLIRLIYSAVNRSQAKILIINPFAWRLSTITNDWIIRKRHLLKLPSQWRYVTHCSTVM